MRYFILFLAILFSFNTAYSQDTLVMKTGVHKLVFVEKTEKNTVYYKKDTASNKIFHAYRSDLHSIKYQNGTVELFSKMAEPKTLTASNGKNTDKTLTDGAADAERHYTRYTAAGTGTLITSLVSPLVGLIPAIACSAKTPSDKNLDIPDGKKAADPAYHADYARRAKSKKSGKVWLNWGIGLGANLVAVIIIAATSSGN